jgi:hypothetical protein
VTDTDALFAAEVQSLVIRNWAQRRSAFVASQYRHFEVLPVSENISPISVGWERTKPSQTGLLTLISTLLSECDPPVSAREFSISEFCDRRLR